MKAPFTLPAAITSGTYLIDARAELISNLPDALESERAFIVNAINLHERMAGAIVELRDATDAEINARSAHRAVYHPTLERLLAAKEAINQLANELSTQKE